MGGLFLARQPGRNRRAPEEPLAAPSLDIPRMRQPHSLRAELHVFETQQRQICRTQRRSHPGEQDRQVAHGQRRVLGGDGAGDGAQVLHREWLGFADAFDLEPSRAAQRISALAGDGRPACLCM